MAASAGRFDTVNHPLIITTNVEPIVDAGSNPMEHRVPLERSSRAAVIATLKHNGVWT
jgi:hypothetical protein